MINDHVAYTFAVVIIAIVGIVVLAAIGVDVPDVLSGVVVALTGAGAALARPTGRR